MLLWPALALAVSVTLQWDYTQGTDLATGFYVYRQDGCAGAFTKRLTTPLPVTQLTFTDTSVQSAKTYCWYTTAVDALGQESTPSNTVSFQLPTLPATPTNLRGAIAP